MARRLQSPGMTGYRVELQGFNTLSDHFLAMAALGDSFFPQLLDVVSDIGVEHAKELVPVSDIDDEDHIHTRDTIDKGPGVVQKREWWTVTYGPTTHYSPFLEYGTRFMSPRPFMIPSGDLVERVLIASIVEFMKLFHTSNGGMGFGTGNIDAGKALQDPRVKGSIGGVRSLLYSTAKFLGDISVLGGREIIGPARGVMYGLARSLGDASSVMNGTLGSRISRRMSGRAVGRLAGIGTSSLSFGRLYSAFPGGEGGRRIYQRSIGRATSIGVGGLGTFGFSR